MSTAAVARVAPTANHRCRRGCSTSRGCSTKRGHADDEVTAAAATTTATKRGKPSSSSGSGPANSSASLFQCDVCSSFVLKEIYICSAAHTGIFCGDCIQQRIMKEKCSMCATGTAKPVRVYMRAIHSEAMRDSLTFERIACPLEGCNVTLERATAADLQQHIDRNCERNVCPNAGCGQRGVIHSAAHVKEQCQHRLVECRLCQVKVSFHDLVHHHLPEQHTHGHQFACVKAGSLTTTPAAVDQMVRQIILPPTLTAKWVFYLKTELALVCAEIQVQPNAALTLTHKFYSLDTGAASTTCDASSLLRQLLFSWSFYKGDDQLRTIMRHGTSNRTFTSEQWATFMHRSTLAVTVGMSVHKLPPPPPLASVAV